jgi:hypothetical protein
MKANRESGVHVLASCGVRNYPRSCKLHEMDDMYIATVDKMGRQVILE